MSVHTPGLTRQEVGSAKHLPLCPSCGKGERKKLSGGDSKDDPYSDRKPSVGSR
jgi:hypothetical protein